MLTSLFQDSPCLHSQQTSFYARGLKEGRASAQQLMALLCAEWELNIFKNPEKNTDGVSFLKFWLFLSVP